MATKNPDPGRSALGIGFDVPPKSIPLPPVNPPITTRFPSGAAAIALMDADTSP